MVAIAPDGVVEKSNGVLGFEAFLGEFFQKLRKDFRGLEELIGSLEASVDRRRRNRGIPFHSLSFLISLVSGDTIIGCAKASTARRRVSLESLVTGMAADMAVSWNVAPIRAFCLQPLRDFLPVTDTYESPPSRTPSSNPAPFGLLEFPHSRILSSVAVRRLRVE
jgi:hypothetical protein